MNIVVPLAGKDGRFESKGLPKPLTLVGGIPIIRRIAESRPYSYSKAIFIILEEHDRDYGIAGKLREFFGDGITIVRAAGETGGAPQSILLAKGIINSGEPLLIDLADQYLDMPGFCGFLQKTKADGVIPTFESLYYNRGYMRYSKGGSVEFVSEKDKVPISTHSTACASYFARGSDFVDAAERMIARKRVAANGAYLVSLAYNEMIGDGKKVVTFPCEFIGTLGTPEGAAAFEQHDRPLSSAREVFGSALLACKAVSHRGAGFGEPENSLAAIKAALGAGFGVETDVRFSSDGAAVLSHDSRTGGLFDRDLDIGKSPLSDLRKLKSKGSGCCIATLDEALSALAFRSAGALAIHVKGNYPQERMDALFSKVASSGAAGRALFVGTEKDSERVLDAAHNGRRRMLAGLHVTLGGEAPKKALLDSADALWIDQLPGYSGGYGKIAAEAKKRGIPSVAMGGEFLLGMEKGGALALAKKARAEGISLICSDMPREAAVA